MLQSIVSPLTSTLPRAKSSSNSVSTRQALVSNRPLDRYASLTDKRYNSLPLTSRSRLQGSAATKTAQDSATAVRVTVDCNDNLISSKATVESRVNSMKNDSDRDLVCCIGVESDRGETLTDKSAVNECSVTQERESTSIRVSEANGTSNEKLSCRDNEACDKHSYGLSSLKCDTKEVSPSVTVTCLQSNIDLQTEASPDSDVVVTSNTIIPEIADSKLSSSDHSDDKTDVINLQQTEEATHLPDIVHHGSVVRNEPQDADHPEFESSQLPNVDSPLVSSLTANISINQQPTNAVSSFRCHQIRSRVASSRFANVTNSVYHGWLDLPNVQPQSSESTGESGRLPTS